MKLIVGLGNPGDKYVNTRHNLGFMVVDMLMSNAKCQMSSQARMSNAKWNTNKRIKAEITEIEFSGKKVILAKPTTYMNDSGFTVNKLVTNYPPAVASDDNFGGRGKLPARSRFAPALAGRQITDVIVVHDDITLELGTIKISKGSGSGKHKGVESIIAHLKTKDFIRVRLGIGRGEGALHDVVLSKFRPDEKEKVGSMVKRASNACMSIIKDGVEKAMNEYN